MQLEASYRQIWKISFPLMLSSIALNIMNLINTAFLGRVSEVALAASAIGGVFYFIFVMFANALGIGAQILISRSGGARDYKLIGKYSDHNFILCGGFSILLFLILHYLSPFLLRFCIQSPAVYAESILYLSYRSYGIIFSLLMIAFRAFYTGVAQTRLISAGIILTSLLNIFFDYGMILGHWGFQATGIKGAGLASTISESIGVLFYLSITLSKKHHKEFHLFKTLKIEFNILKEMIKLASPIMVQNVISLGAWFLFFVFIEKLGEHALAVSNIIRSIYMLLMTPIWGYAAATTTLVSNQIGQSRAEMIPVVIKKVVIISFISSILMMGLNIFFPEILLGIFTKDPQMLRDAYPLLNILSLALIFFSVAVVLLTGVSGTSDTRFALGIEMTAIFFYMVYLYLQMMVFKPDLVWIWASEFVYWTCIGSLSAIRLKKKITQLIRDQGNQTATAPLPYS